MANLLAKHDKTNFRYVANIDQLSESQLASLGYYVGYPCPHRHRIRDIEHHWCYHCVIKIKSNICGFNLNFIHPYYNYKYEKLWKSIEVGHWNECWEANLPGAKGPRRIAFPSYRSHYTGRASENVTPQKLIYQCAWGDIGSLTVSKVCGNPWCCNPLHLISSWNNGMPPASVAPFDLSFKPEILMMLSKAEAAGRQQELIERYYKNTILHPSLAPEAPYYDEG
jgi:hypothetical protein